MKKFCDGHILLLLFNLEKGKKNKLYIEPDFRLLISPKIALTDVVIIFFQHTTVNLMKICKAFISYFKVFMSKEVSFFSPFSILDYSILK